MAHRIEHGPLIGAVHVGKEIILGPFDLHLIGCSFVDPRPPGRSQIVAEHFGQAMLVRQLERRGRRHLRGKPSLQFRRKIGPQHLLLILAAFHKLGLRLHRGRGVGQSETGDGQRAHLAGPHSRLKREAVQDRPLVAGQPVVLRASSGGIDKAVHFVDGQAPALVHVGVGVLDGH
ncbi:MAG: hypothetical protein ABSB33_06755 [Tepidisphaeraceae bacterium]